MTEDVENDEGSFLSTQMIEDKLVVDTVSRGGFSIDADELVASFPTQKQVLVSLVTNRAPKKNEHYNNIISSNLTLENLFDD